MRGGEGERGREGERGGRGAGERGREGGGGEGERGKGEGERGEGGVEGRGVEGEGRGGEGGEGERGGGGGGRGEGRERGKRGEREQVKESDLLGSITLFELTRRNASDLPPVLDEEQEAHPEEEVKGEHEEGEADEVNGVPRVGLRVQARRAC